MRKPFKEEMHVLKKELPKLKLFVLSLILSGELSAQIPINGFCKFSTQKILSGYSSLFTLNYNNDAYADFILFNSSTQKILSLEGQVGGKTVVNGEFNIPSSISNVQTVFNGKREVQGYLFTSRKNREVGILNFNEIGKPSVIKKIKFDSYPEHISSFTNFAGQTELLVCGSSFNGISIFKFRNDELLENKIISRTPYKTALLVDISNDGYTDIAAYNLLKNQIDFFYNNGLGEYRFVRSITVKGEIVSLKNFDISFDGYQDIVYSTSKSIEIIYGDFASRYDVSASIKTSLLPDEFAYGDFNKDGFFDLSYLNRKTGTINLLFARSEKKFYEEIPYLQRKGIKNFLPFYSKFVKGIIALNESGEIYTITNLNGFSEDVSILPAIKPSKINYFDKDNNGIIDLCFIEEYTNSLNLIIRNPEGIPTAFYSYPLSGEHNNFLIDDQKVDRKSFYCFSYNQRLIEILDINFEQNLFERNEIYSPGIIKDIKIKKSESDESRSMLLIAYTKANQLSLGKYEYHDFRYTLINYPSLASDVYTANISSTGEADLYYWQKDNDNYNLFRFNIINSNSASDKLFELPAKGIIPIGTFSGDLFNKSSSASISLFEDSNNYAAVVTSGINAQLISNNFMLRDFRITDRNQLFFGEMRFNGLNYLFVYLPEKKSVKKIAFIKDGKSVWTDDLVFADHLTSYFIKNLDSKKYHLVYTDQFEGCIKIKRL